MAEDQTSKNERVLHEIIQEYNEKFKRPGSAPPTSLYFVNDNDYAQHFRTNFMNLRQRPEYEEFYREKGSPSQLPPPLSKKPEVDAIKATLQVPDKSKRQRRLSTVDSIDVDQELSSANLRKSSFTLDKITENMNQIIGDMTEEHVPLVCRPNDQKEEEELHPHSPVRSLQSQFANMSLSEEQKSPTHHYIVPAHTATYHHPSQPAATFQIPENTHHNLKFNVHVHAPQQFSPWGGMIPGAYPVFQPSPAPDMIQKGVRAAPAGPPSFQQPQFQPIQDFRNKVRGGRNQYPNDMTIFELKQVLMDPLQVGLDQGGCRMLQSKLDANDPELVQYIINAMMPVISELYMAQFGNYLCQKIFERANEPLLEMCISHLQGREFQICSNSQGTRTIQKLVEATAKYPALLIKMREILRPHVVRMVQVGLVSYFLQDINGNHVIQKCLQEYSLEDAQFVYDQFLEGCYEIATHKHGCCVLQKCITKADPENKERLINKVIELTSTFVKDPFANYVVQFLLEKKDFTINKRIADQLKGSYLELSTEKFSSNVIEKCLEFNSQQTQNEIVFELLQAQEYLDILKNNYGNYVIQKALNAASPQYFDRLVKCLRPEMAILKNSNEFGQKIYHKLVRNYPQLAVHDWENFQQPPRSGNSSPYKGTPKKKHVLSGKRSHNASPSHTYSPSSNSPSRREQHKHREVQVVPKPTPPSFENFSAGAEVGQSNVNINIHIQTQQNGQYGAPPPPPAAFYPGYKEMYNQGYFPGYEQWPQGYFYQQWPEQSRGYFQQPPPNN